MNAVCEELTIILRPISSKEKVSQVGTISANADAEIGNLISDRWKGRCDYSE